MTRAKILLSGIAIFAIIGGAFAVKSTRNFQPFFRTNAQGLCKSAFQTTYTTTVISDPLAFTTNTLSPVAIEGPCPVVTVKTIP